MAVDGDDSIAPLFKRALVHARLVIKSLQVRVGAQLHQVAPTRKIFREQHQMEPSIFKSSVGSIRAITQGHIRFDS